MSRRQGIGTMFWGLGLAALMLASASTLAETPVKKASTLYPPSIVERLRANCANEPWGPAFKDAIVSEAQVWANKSDDELWDLVFGATITRSWMVWSNGYCPACKKDVPMYTWVMDALDHPWKTRCPHCQEWFPKNDFGAYYRSGLDEKGIFDPQRADKALLFNTEHPNADDPLHLFGVDDGEGFEQDGHRWRFIGAYLIYGQFKQAILGGVQMLSGAYLLTGDPVFAHKAGVLLDRLADVYPTFDFKAQGEVYEVKAAAGYISTWHDTCEETRQLVMGYDAVFEALRQDGDLVAFLSKKAAEHGLENPKTSFGDIQRNIEDRILRDPLANEAKIHSNYPRTEVTKAIIYAVLGWEENRDAFWNVVNPMIEKATAVDGVTGEKGLAGYAAYTIQALGLFLAEFSKADPDFLKDALARQPRIRDAFRFHIDMKCLDRYYPQSGDTGGFAQTCEGYCGMTFSAFSPPSSSNRAWFVLPPSSYTLLWHLYEQTGDPAFVQTLYRTNHKSLDGLPYDLFIQDPAAVREGVRQVIEREGDDVKLGPVNKQQWHMGILRSGEGDNARAVWLDYDSGGGHGHADGMNLGLFAKGLDLMPEFGYPPVQFGGWNSERARWYTMSAAHNTVVVDGANSAAGAGQTTLWAEASQLHVIRAAGSALNGDNRFERTAALVDAGPESCYVVDIFRLEGGAEHVKFMHGHYGTVATSGLSMQPQPEYGHKTQMRNFQADPGPKPGWTADWTVEDRLHLLPEERAVHVRYTDVTPAAQAGLAEAWIATGGYNDPNETWIPRVYLRRTAAEGQTLISSFSGIIEPYEGQPMVGAVRRIGLQKADGTLLREGSMALIIDLADGRQDVVIARDPVDAPCPEPVIVPDLSIETDADFTLVRLVDNGASVQYAALCSGGRLTVNGAEIITGAVEAVREFSR